MFNSNVPSVADIAAVTDNNCNNGYGGYGEGWWVLIILFALFGGWGRGGAFGGNGAGCDGACATVGDVERGFNNQSTQQRFNGIDQGLCQLGYDNLAQITSLQNTVMQGNFGLQQAISNASVANMQGTNALSRQLADCCWETREAIQGVNYNMAMGFNNVTNTICNSTRDITDNQNANTRAILDQINAFRMEDKDAQIRNLETQVQSLNLAVSQRNQNDYLVDQLRPCPVPAYITCNPWGANGYGGYGYGGCCNTQSTCCC